MIPDPGTASPAHEPMAAYRQLRQLGLLQPDPAQQLQVAGTIGERDPDAGREVFNAGLALAEMFEHFDTVGMPEPLRDRRETSEDMLFRTEA